MLDPAVRFLPDARRATWAAALERAAALPSDASARRQRLDPELSMPSRSWHAFDVRAMTATAISAALNEQHAAMLRACAAWELERSAWAEEREAHRAQLRAIDAAYRGEREAWEREREAAHAAIAKERAELAEERRAMREWWQLQERDLASWRGSSSQAHDAHTGDVGVATSDAVAAADAHELVGTSICSAVEESELQERVAALRAEHEVMMQVLTAEKGLELYQSCGGRRWCSKHWRLLSPRAEIQDHLLAVSPPDLKAKRGRTRDNWPSLPAYARRGMAADG